MLPAITTEVPGPRSRALMARSDLVEPAPLTGGSSNSGRVFWQSGSGPNITDVDGNIYLDLTSAFGVSIAGHAPPHVASALELQSSLLLHSMGDMFPNASKIEVAEKLLTILNLPEPTWRVAFGTSGSDVIELALKVASKHTNRNRFLAFDLGYHGQALGALPVMGHTQLREPFLQLLRPAVDFFHFPEERQFDPAKFEREITDALAAHEYAAVIVEPVQGLSGYRFLSPEAVPIINNATTARGALLIIDEIFSGFWRAGYPLYSTKLGLRGDLICVGKSLGGGVPFAALIAKAQLWAELENRASCLPLHGGTFAGDPLCCAAVIANLNWFELAEIGRGIDALAPVFSGRLSELSKTSKFVLAVRGAGLVWAIEINPEVENVSERVVQIIKRCLARGVIVVQTGFPRGNVIGVAPPATINSGELDFGIRVVAEEVQAEDRA